MKSSRISLIRATDSLIGKFPESCQQLFLLSAIFFEKFISDSRTKRVNATTQRLPAICHEYVRSRTAEALFESTAQRWFGTHFGLKKISCKFKCLTAANQKVRISAMRISAMRITGKRISAPIVELVNPDLSVLEISTSVPLYCKRIHRPNPITAPQKIPAVCHANVRSRTSEVLFEFAALRWFDRKF